jgi:hypothetical protein
MFLVRGSIPLICSKQLTITNQSQLKIKQSIIMTNNQIKTTINHHNSYSVFCMANIIGVNIRELDIIWDKAIEVYNLFAESKFNVDTMSELDCMELFYREYHARQEFLKRGTYMMLDKQVRESIVSIIDNLNTMNVDGETMEFIIKNVGMEDQMLSQLSYPLRVENESLKHRLRIVSEEEKSLRMLIDSDNIEPITLLNNIEIACDLNSNESLIWNTKS